MAEAEPHPCEFCYNPVDTEAEDFTVRPVKYEGEIEFCFWHSEHFPENVPGRRKKVS